MRSGLFACRIELLQVGDDAIDVLLVRQSWKDHLGVRYLCTRVLKIFLERCFVPDETGILIGWRIVVSFNSPCFRILGRLRLVILRAAAFRPGFNAEPPTTRPSSVGRAAGASRVAVRDEAL